MVKYWVKHNRIHIYPVNPPCGSIRKDEKLYDRLEDVPKHEKCPICFAAGSEATAYKRG